MVKRLLILFLFLYSSADQVFAQFPYTESFRNSTAQGIIFGGAPAAFLTAFGSSAEGGTPIDPNGTGYLRLTNSTRNQKGYVYNQTKFPSTQGLKVEFEYCIYGGNGADGISFFLFDAAASPFNIGGFGGSLGYAQITTTNPVSPGVSKGYLGVGLDEFGNFSNANEGRQGGTARVPGSVTLRGKGDGAALSPNNYKFLTSQQTDLKGVSLVGDPAKRVTDPTQPGYRKVLIELIPNPASGYNINVKITKGGSPQITTTIIDNYYYPEAAPAQLSYGFSSSTGAQTNFHEIRNVSIDLYNPNPVANDDAATTPFNTNVQIPILVNDTQGAGTAAIDPASIIIKSNPSNGTVSINSSTGIVTYIPNTGYFGQDTFTYSVKNRDGLESNTATVLVTVRNNTTIPIITPDFNINVETGRPRTIIVTIPQGGAVRIVSPPTHGRVVLDPITGLPVYTSDLDYFGTDTFTYELIDADGNVSPRPGTVTINILSPAKIGLAKNLVSSTKNTDGTYNIIYLFTLVNSGNTAIESISLTDDLGATFPGCKVIVNRLNTSGILYTNPAYDGLSDKNMLLPTSTMTPLSKEQVTLEINVALLEKGGTFNNSAAAEGASASDGALTFDISTDGLNPDPIVSGDVSPADPTPVTLLKNPLFIPKGFSPNNDGINDLFVIENGNGRQILLEVYNRWGNRIYRNKDYKNDWNGLTTEGIHIGDQVPVGTYYYVVIADNHDKYVGYITINR